MENMNGQNILCIEDDSFVRSMISTYLKEDGFCVFEGENGDDLKDTLASEEVDLIVLDLVLPGQDGIALINFVRNHKKYHQLPIIMISAKGEDVDRIIGLETGADDYLAKPFLPRELKARILSILKRSSYQVPANEEDRDTGKYFSFGEWELYPDQYQVFDQGGCSANLTTSEFTILYSLIKNAHSVITRDRLFEVTRHITSESFDRAVDVQITRIRKKIRDDARSPKYIQTVRGVGYLFCAGVEAHSV